MANKTANRTPKREPNVCVRNYDGEHRYEVLNLTPPPAVMPGSMSYLPSTMRHVAFCTRCANTVEIK